MYFDLFVPPNCPLNAIFHSYEFTGNLILDKWKRVFFEKLILKILNIDKKLKQIHG